MKLKPGKRRATRSVTVLGDDLHESNETVRVKLTNPKRAQIEHAVAIGTIIDNDPASADDSDGDGIPDGLDACPNDYDPDGYCPASVYGITDGSVTHGSKVRVSNPLITAVDPGGAAAWVEVQSGDVGFAGVKGSALKLDLSSVSSPPALQIGDRVSVAGRTATGVFDASTLEVLSSGETPEVAVVDLPKLGDPRYNNLLVSIPGETLSGQSAGDWALFDGLAVEPPADRHPPGALGRRVLQLDHGDREHLRDDPGAHAPP